MSKPKFTVSAELYELPNMFGFWISDPDQMRLLEAEVKGKWWRSAYVFIGDYLLLELDLKPDDEDSSRIATYVKHYNYTIDGPELILEPLIITDDDQVEHGPPAGRSWAMTSDGRFNLQLEGYWWRFVPATIEELEAAGFNRKLIELYVEDAKEEGLEVIETFDEAKARQLIKEARAREDAEN